MSEFGLIGKNISYSFSKTYFTEKFKSENLPNVYNNYDIQDIEEINAIVTNNSQLKGLNVTIPYKEVVIPHLDKISKTALKIGAVNTIKISENGTLKGYNTDYFGFKKCLTSIIKPQHNKALILGTGGASKAIAYALLSMEIPYSFVSRNYSDKVNFVYQDLTQQIIEHHPIIINCTPLGTHPNITQCPDIPYQFITEKHLLFDLIYNPSETLFLSKGKQNGAQIMNGLAMLIFQAEKAWEIWNK